MENFKLQKCLKSCNPNSDYVRFVLSFKNHPVLTEESTCKICCRFFSTQFDSLLVKSSSSHPSSTKATVCDTKRLHTPFTVRHTLFLCSYKFCFLHFSSVSPFTRIPQLIACIFSSLLYFCLVLCYFFVLSLNFSTFLHCNYNTSLFLTFYFFGICLGDFGCPVCQPSKL